MTAHDRDGGHIRLPTSDWMAMKEKGGMRKRKRTVRQGERL